MSTSGTSKMHETAFEIGAFASVIRGEFALDEDVIAGQINEGNFGVVRNAHDLIHRFIRLAPEHIDTDEKFHAKAAFLIYQNDAFDVAHLAFYESLAAHYAVARILLRSTLELILRGTFLNCLADKSFRDNAGIIGQRRVSLYGDKNFKRTIIDWLNEVIENSPEVENEMKENSATVLDKVSPIFTDQELQRKLIPPTQVLIEQLAAWRMFDPVPSAVDRAHQIYSNLSGDIHGAPEGTDTGRRILSDVSANPFTKQPIPGELEAVCKLIKEVMEIGIALEMNVVSSQ